MAIYSGRDFAVQKHGRLILAYISCLWDAVKDMSLELEANGVGCLVSSGNQPLQCERGSVLKLGKKELVFVFLSA